MLAERESTGRPLPVRAALALLALLLGLTGVLVGTPSARALDPGAPVRDAVAVPIVLPQGTTGLINADALAQFTSPDGILTRQLDAAINRPVALAIDPRIIASIRVLGTAAPATATAWLERLATASNDTFALSYADSNLTLATQAGNQGILTPLSLDFAIDPSLFAATPETPETPSPTPSPTADPASPTLPTTESLLEWNYTLTDIAWPLANTVVSTDITALSAAGYETTILASGNVIRDEAVSSVVQVDEQRVLVSDDAVSNALAAAARALTDAEWEAAMGEVYAAIANSGAAQSGSEATVFAVFDRSAPLAGSRVAETITDLTLKATLTSISSVLAATPTSATIADEPQSAESIAAASALLLAEQAEQRFAAIAADPDALIGQRRLALLAVLSNAWASNPTGMAKAADGYLETSLDLRNSVSIVQSSSLNFFADSASIPIAVENTLNQAVTVYITVHPETALLAVSDSLVELTIEPNSQGKGEVPVQAISNGTVQLTVTLSGPNGEPIGVPSRTKVNVQAGWETPIVLAIAIIVVGIFGVGIVRNILRRRKRAVDDAPADPAHD